MEVPLGSVSKVQGCLPSRKEERIVLRAEDDHSPSASTTSSLYHSDEEIPSYVHQTSIDDLDSALEGPEIVRKGENKSEKLIEGRKVVGDLNNQLDIEDKESSSDHDTMSIEEASSDLTISQVHSRFSPILTSFYCRQR